MKIDNVQDKMLENDNIRNKMLEIDNTALDKFAEDFSSSRMKRIRESTNAELAEKLEAYVVPNLGLLSFQSDLVESAIERLKNGT